MLLTDSVFMDSLSVNFQKKHHDIKNLFSNIIYGLVDFSWKRHPTFPQELRACNDDRTDRDLQLDGGGISDQPVIISVHPLAQVGMGGGGWDLESSRNCWQIFCLFLKPGKRKHTAWSCFLFVQMHWNLIYIKWLDIIWKEIVFPNLLLFLPILMLHFGPCRWGVQTPPLEGRMILRVVYFLLGHVKISNLNWPFVAGHFG